MRKSDARASGLASARYDAQDNARDNPAIAATLKTQRGLGMTSRQASEKSLRRLEAPAPGDDRLCSLSTAVRQLTSDDSPAACFAVAPAPEAVTEARHFATTLLRSWGMDCLCDDMGLVVTELVTNALRHGMPTCPPPATESVWLRMMRRAPYVMCGVVDAGAGTPQRREPDFVAESGRGLYLVDSFSRRWGWQGIGSGRKVVWALFSASPGRGSL